MTVGRKREYALAEKTTTLASIEILQVAPSAKVSLDLLGETAGFHEKKCQKRRS